MCHHGQMVPLLADLQKQCAHLPKCYVHLQSRLHYENQLGFVGASDTPEKLGIDSKDGCEMVLYLLPLRIDYAETHYRLAGMPEKPATNWHYD